MKKRKKKRKRKNNMLAFIGLGNPDNTYQFTKHNIGREIVENFAKKEKLKFKAGKGHFFFLNVL